MKKPVIRVGGDYSNGVFGRHWSVRHVLSRHPAAGEDADCVVYRVLVGAGRRKQFTCSLEAFQRWTIYAVVRNETSWVRVEENAGTDTGLAWSSC